MNRYTALLNSLEDEALWESQDQDRYLIFCWDPDISMPSPSLNSFSKFRKGVGTFVLTGFFFLAPKVSFAKDIPKKNTSEIVVFRDGVPDAVKYSFETGRRDSALAIVSGAKKLFLKEKAVVASTQQKPVDMTRQAKNKVEILKLREYVKSTQQETKKSTEKCTQKTKQLVVNHNKNRKVLREAKRKAIQKALQEAKGRAIQKAKLKYQQLQQLLKYQQLLVAGGINLEEMSTAQKDALIHQKEQLIRYYRFLSKAVFAVSLASTCAIVYRYNRHMKKARKVFDKLLAKYLSTKAKYSETAEVNKDIYSKWTELVPKWKDLVAKHNKIVAEKNREIKKIRATAANEVSTLELVIDMLKDERDSLVKKLEFIKEHGTP